MSFVALAQYASCDMRQLSSVPLHIVLYEGDVWYETDIRHCVRPHINLMAQ